MDYLEYRDYVIGTTKESYPRYVQELIIKRLKELNIVEENGNISSLNDAFDISVFKEEEKLIKSIEQRTEVVKFIEEWEFLKAYKYAVLFSVENFNLDDIRNHKDILTFSKSINKFDTLIDVNLANINNSLVKPTIYENQEVLFLKINCKFEATHPLTTNMLKVKYPVLVVFHKKLEILEIRFDKINMYLKEKETFYKDMVNFALGWLKSNFDIQIQNLNLVQHIKNILDKNSEEVKVHAQCMSLRQGGKATLEVGNNREYILPLLGELKELIKEHEEEFNKSPKIKGILEEFIEDTEKTSNLPWISLCWKNEVKVRQIIVKFLHNYMNEEYTLLQYLGVQRDMERMTHVTKFINEN